MRGEGGLEQEGGWRCEVTWHPLRNPLTDWIQDGPRFFVYTKGRRELPSSERKRSHGGMASEELRREQFALGMLISQCSLVIQLECSRDSWT